MTMNYLTMFTMTELIDMYNTVTNQTN